MRTQFAGIFAPWRRPWSICRLPKQVQRPKNRILRFELLEGRALLDGLAWSAGPTLPAARGQAEALNTAIGVLVTGGANSAAGTTTPRGAYILDPTSNSWAADLAIDRGRNAGGIGATGSFGPIGNDGSKYLSDVMLFGGASAGQPTASVFNYNLYQVSDTGDAGTPPAMSTARYQFAYATDPATGDLYAIGGLSDANQVLASVERYDPVADAWQSLAASPQALDSASAASDGAGHILVFGGRDSTGTALNTVYRYTIATDRWDTAAAMPSAVSGTAAVFGAYGQIYVIGGLTTNGPVAAVEIYSPVTDQWTSDAPLPAPEYGAAAVIDSAGNLDVIGGFDAAGNAVTTVYQSPALPAPVGLPAVPSVQLFADALYNGAPQAADAVALAADGITPVDGTFTFTYDGSVTPPTNAGAYQLVATFTSHDPNYVNTVGSGTFYIDQATPTLNISGGGTITYDGLPHPITASVVGVDDTTPVNGNFNITYNGAAAAPINPGTYSVLAAFTSTDPNYTGASATTTIVIPDPTVPTGVTVSGASTSTLRVSWNVIAGAAYYNVYQRHVLHSPRGSLVTITYPLVAGHVTGTSVVVGATSGTFRVTSVSSGGVESPPSVLASGSALSAPYLASFLLGGAVMSSAGVNVGHTLQFTLLGYGNEAPTYAMTSGPATMSVDPATGIVTYSPVAGEAGTVLATFTAANSVGSSSATFAFRVEPSLVPGDWNQDGKADMGDVAAMLNALTDLPDYERENGMTEAQLLIVGDANADGSINNVDLPALLTLAAVTNGGGGATAAAKAVVSSLSPSIAISNGVSIQVAARSGVTPTTLSQDQAPAVADQPPLDEFANSAQSDSSWIAPRFMRASQQLLRAGNGIPDSNKLTSLSQRFVATAVDEILSRLTHHRQVLRDSMTKVGIYSASPMELIETHRAVESVFNRNGREA